MFHEEQKKRTLGLSAYAPLCRIRIEQINALLQQIIAKIFIENIEFEPGVLATITRVDTAADLGHAKIFVSVLPLAKKKEALDKIRKSIFEIQK